MGISRHQISAAMALLGLMQKDVSAGTGISQVTVSNMLRGDEAWTTKQSTIDKVVTYLEDMGVEFLPNEGLRRKPHSSIVQLEGRKGFLDFMRMVLDSAQSPDADICVSGVDERLFEHWVADETEEHLRKITALHDKYGFSFRIMIEEGDNQVPASSYARYRRLPSGYFTPSPVYVFGDKVALIEFDYENAFVWVINSRKLAKAQRRQFNLVWDRLVKNKAG
ncbi:MAG: helix-turn-helix domain-containing protein [Alphaproteobacteria bacterium]